MIIKKNQVTISDVAKLAGVSPSTVSRVISDSPKISEATKEKVLKHMDELGYYPNAIARSLAKNITGNIGVIMPTRAEDIFLNPFFPEALRGIIKAAAKTGYDILLSTNTGLEDELTSIKKLINGSKVDGIVLMSSKIDDESINYLVSMDFPFSLIGSPYKTDNGINHVDNDNFMAAYELTMYLTFMGKKNIVMIAGDPSLMVTKKRIEGYRKAIEESNLEFNDNHLFIGDFDEETGYKYGREILGLEPRPDAVIVTDDLVAFGAIQVFESFDINIPEDIAIASFNNSVLSRYSQTPFTSVDINAYDLGSESIKLLVEAIEKGIKNRKTIIPYKIHKRKSTEIV
ncbi:MAG: LacI family DNA-binding transcriptional regulator [Tissierellaceae bacterium]|nr:LacI family DNA-binding transcriptional regulator [Tissierellaceae bacterium]